MPRPRVYIETTIPSAYFESRTEPSVVRRRDATRKWWATAATRYELRTSAYVLQELGRGPADRTAAWIELLADVELLVAEKRVAGIVRAYIQHKLMPADPGGDAVHLALATHHRCDFLVTWNYRHLANPNKFRHIRQVNTGMGLFVPTIVTPEQLLGGEDEP